MLYEAGHTFPMPRKTAVRLNVNEDQLATYQSSNDCQQHSRY